MLRHRRSPARDRSPEGGAGCERRHVLHKDHGVELCHQGFPPVEEAISPPRGLGVDKFNEEIDVAASFFEFRVQRRPE